MMSPTRVRVPTGQQPNPDRERARVRSSVLTGVLTAVFVVMAASGAGPTPPATTIPMALISAIGFVIIQVIHSWSSPWTVSVGYSSGRLTMVGHHWLTFALEVALAISAIAIGLAQLDPTALEGMTRYERAAVTFLPPFGLALLLYQLWTLRRPAGLTLTPSALYGVRRGPAINLTWNHLISVHALTGKRTSSLILGTVEGPQRIRGSAVGGDLHAVASVIDYYLRHPDERHRLSDGIAAVEHVDAEYRAGRYRWV